MNNTINEIKTAKEKLERELAILVGAALFKFRQENNIIVNGIFFDLKSFLVKDLKKNKKFLKIMTL